MNYDPDRIDESYQKEMREEGQRSVRRSLGNLAFAGLCGFALTKTGMPLIEALEASGIAVGIVNGLSEAVHAQEAFDIASSSPQTSRIAY